MATQAHFIGPSFEERLLLTAPAESGDVVAAPSGRCGIVNGAGQEFAIGDAVNVTTEGRANMATGGSLTASAGQDVNWNDTTKQIVTSGGNWFAGTLTRDVASGDEYAEVLLNMRPGALAT